MTPARSASSSGVSSAKSVAASRSTALASTRRPGAPSSSPHPPHRARHPASPASARHAGNRDCPPTGAPWPPAPPSRACWRCSRPGFLDRCRRLCPPDVGNSPSIMEDGRGTACSDGFPARFAPFMGVPSGCAKWAPPNVSSNTRASTPACSRLDTIVASAHSRSSRRLRAPRHRHRPGEPLAPVRPDRHPRLPQHRPEYRRHLGNILSHGASAPRRWSAGSIRSDSRHPAKPAKLAESA